MEKKVEPIIINNRKVYRPSIKGDKVKFKNTKKLYSEIVTDLEDTREVLEVIEND